MKTKRQIRRRDLVTLLVLVVAMSATAALALSINSPASTPQGPSRASQIESNRRLGTGELNIPAVGDNPGSEANSLLTQDDYWRARLSYPSGKYDGSWFLQAAGIHSQMPVGIPAGQVTYNKGSSKSPLALDPNALTPLGPAPLQTDGCVGCFNDGIVGGRVDSIAIDPVTPNVAYIATNGSGIWKTTNCCSTNTTWTYTFDSSQLSTTVVGAITIDPNNHNVLYAGTGEFWLGLFGFGSNGILKSTNQGSSWQVLAPNVFTPTFEINQGGGLLNTYRWEYQAVSTVRVDPRSSNNVVAGTKSGPFFSYDGGVNWTGPCFTNGFSSTQRQDISAIRLQDAGGSTTVYAAVGYAFGTGGGGTNYANGANGIYTATLPTSGCPANWNLITRDTNGWPTGTGNGTQSNSKPGRIEMAVAPSNPSVIYAEVSNANAAHPGLGGVWRTTDSGANWTLQATQASLFDCTGSPLNTNYEQHWYDQAIDVDPHNPNVIIISGVDAWKSTDGGVTYYDITCGYSGGDTIHVDQHDTHYLPGSSTMLLQGNDGGIYLTTNADVISPTRPIWNQLNNSLNSIEFYGGDITGNFATGPNPGANGGSQDNNSEVATWSNPASVGPTQWQARQGGDGMYAHIEPVFNQRWYQESQNGNMTVSLNGPLGPRQSANGGWTADTRSFVFPYEIFKGNPSGPAAQDCDPSAGCTHMIAGSNRVWETIQGAVPATSWYTNSPNLTRGVPGRSYINRLNYSPTISTTAIVGTNDGYVWIGFGLGQGVPASATWTNVTTATNMALPQRWVLGVAIAPDNPLVGYAALGGFDQNTPGAPGHVFQITCTANCATSTWVNKTGNLPNFPVNTILPNPKFPQQVFAGTDLGLYFTNDITVASPVWVRFEAGVPNIKVWDLQVDRGWTTLSVWTRGHGAYAWPLPSSPFIQPSPTPTVTGTPPTATPFTPSPTATAGACFSYGVVTSTTTLIPGVQDIGNHCDDCNTTIQLPFPVTLYDRTFTQAFPSSNGSLELGLATASINTACLPDRNQQYAVMAYQNDLCTGNCGGATCVGCGIFTATLGTAPNRQYILEWRAIHFGVTETPSNFEIILTENSNTISVVYGVTTDMGAGEQVGVQQTASTHWTQYSCLSPALTPGLRIDFVRQSCPTSTPTVTSTPTATYTACPVQFTDVPNGSTFYPYIRCLACRGIVSGYDDHTFRPNNNVTRGQLSKIISNSAGFNETHTTQDFQDVPVGSTFYIYIERLVSRGILGGYPCGGPGEPCGPGNLPYFRPNANATRGQITKIDANAAGYSDPPVGQQFQDVPPGSTFYTYTYQLVTRGIMSGYPCSGPGEPCVPPGNLPYFRPNNNATRGQTAKIVANTFFPNCQTPSGPRDIRK